MANAWMIKPLPIVAASGTTSALGEHMNLANDYAGVVWRAVNSPTAALKLDLGADTTFDTVMLFGVFGANVSTAVVNPYLATAAQGDGFDGSDVSTGVGTGNFKTLLVHNLLAGSIMPISGQGVGIISWSAGPPAANRHLMLYISGLGAGAFVQISRIVIGKRIQLERNFSFGAAFGVRDLGSLDFNRRGVMSRILGKIMRTVGLTFSSVYPDEVAASTRPLIEQIGNTRMIALVTDPTADADRQNRCYYGPLVGDLGHVWRTAKAFEVKVNQVSIF